MNADGLSRRVSRDVLGIAGFRLADVTLYTNLVGRYMRGSGTRELYGQITTAYGHFTGPQSGAPMGWAPRTPRLGAAQTTSHAFRNMKGQYINKQSESSAEPKGLRQECLSGFQSN